MKNIVVLGTCALMLTLPSISSALTLANTFLTSSNGNSLIEVGDTIQFEVTLTLDEGRAFTTVLWTLSGDILTAETENLPFPNTQNLVTNWEWNYVANKGRDVKMGTNGRITTSSDPVGLPPLGPVTGFYGFSAAKTGNGVASLVGTVTILATADGTYQGGAYFQPGGNIYVVYCFDCGLLELNVVGGEFTVGVIPEPSTSLLVMVGLGGLGLMGRLAKR